MCTAMTLRNRQGEIFFGRTMDFSWPLTPSLYVVPQGSVWDNAPRTARIRDRYSFLGIGQELAPAGGEQAQPYRSRAQSKSHIIESQRAP